jgi:hypothetical protein
MTAAYCLVTTDDLTPEMVELLTAAAQTTYGRVCYPFQVRGRERVLAAMQARKFLYWDGATPMITDAGRVAVGGPSFLELHRKNRAELCFASAVAEAGQARKRAEDPRSRITYQSYQTSRMFCTLVVKLAEPPVGARGLKCSMSGDPARFFWLPLSQIITQPESKNPFALIVVPKWLAKPFDPKRIPELTNVIPDLCDSVEWTDEQKDDWNRLRRKAGIINTRIRSGGARRSSDRQSGAIFA